MTEVGRLASSALRIPQRAAFDASRFLLRRAEDLDAAAWARLLHFAGLDHEAMDFDATRLWAPGAPKRSHGVSMLPETKMMLRDFYGPYVLELQNMFNNTALAWW
ncbi:unnamed protein product [Effrenium voratum]|nr:unnamed protein product [Effrenium voratum]